MIGYLSGKVLDHSDGRVLVAVGLPDGGSVGYSVMIPASDEHVGLIHGDRVELFVHTHVREDALDLYGFRSAAEKDLFLTLLSVNGIGPKLALNILSGADAGQLIQAILSGNKTFLSQIPGIGKKTAERIVLELADKIRKKSDAGLYAALQSKTAPAGASAYDAGSARAANALVRDAALALVGLGFRENDATQVLNRLVEESSGASPKVEDLIRLALRHL